MASPVVERIPKEQDTSTLWNLKGEDPMVDSWPLMRSPIPLLIILSTYFAIITVGPKIMKNKKPMELKTVIFYYNLVQIISSGCLSYLIYAEGFFKDGFLLAGCRYSLYTRDWRVLAGTYTYFLMKITELLDTVFFVLRKKNNQITFLHVYHHVTMVVYMWSYLKYGAAGDGAVLAFLNCFVHVVMYSYYLLSSLGPKFQKYLWWKKYVTELQLIQFILMLIYLSYTHFQPTCRFSNFFTSFIGTNVSIYLILFLNFYLKTFKSNFNKIKPKLCVN